MLQRYTQYGLNPYFTAEIFLEGPGADQVFCTGVQKIGDDGGEGFIADGGLAGSWGTNLPDKNYPEMTETLGIGIQVEPENLVKAREDNLNYLMEVKPDSNGKITYYVNFVSAMEKNAPENLGEWRKRLEYWQRAVLADYPSKIIKN